MIPNTISFSGELLLKMRDEGALSSETLEKIRKIADEYLEKPYYNVVASGLVAESGDAHDFASMGPYWWPDPDKPNGLPYIRRDGEINPETQDDNVPKNMAAKAFALAIAAFYLGDDKYAKGAVRSIYDWHLNSETYMNPNAEYAQSIPGICKGRGIGIIDFCHSHKVFDALGILRYIGAVDDEFVEKIKEWYGKFADWLLTSENGLCEDTELNTHGTFYDVTVLSIALFTGRESLAKKICETAYYRRFVLQTEPDGAQPLELARTMGMHYSLANSRGLVLIASMAAKVGYTKYWDIDDERGVCIARSTIDYIYPYAKNIESFPYMELKPHLIPEMMAHMLYALDWIYPGEGYAEKVLEFELDPIEASHPFK